MSVVNAATIAGKPSNVRSRTNGSSSVKSTLAESPTAATIFADQKDQRNVDSIFSEPLCSGDLRRNNSLGITGAAAINAVLVLRRSDERRHRVHVCGKDDRRIRLLRRSRVDIGALAFDCHSSSVVTQASQ